MTGTDDLDLIPRNETFPLQYSLCKVLASTVSWIPACCTTG